MRSSPARGATPASTSSSSGGGADSPGCQKLVIPTAPESRVAQLLERGPLVPDGVVDRADEERRLGVCGRLLGAVGRLVVAAAAREGQRRDGERTANSALPRTTTGPGRVACTKVTESL